MSGSVSTTASAGIDASSSTADAAKEKQQLAKLLRTYQADINQGQKADSLKSLAKQITDLAKQLGQNVTLPKPTTSGATTATATPPPAPGGKAASATLSVTA